MFACQLIRFKRRLLRGLRLCTHHHTALVRLNPNPQHATKRQGRPTLRGARNSPRFFASLRSCHNHTPTTIRSVRSGPWCHKQRPEGTSLDTGEKSRNVRRGRRYTTYNLVHNSRQPRQRPHPTTWCSNDEPIAPHCRCILLRSAQHRRRGGVAHEAQVRLQHTHTHSVAHRGGRCTLEEGAPQQARASLVPATGSNARRHLGSQPGLQPVHGRIMRCQQRSARPYTRTVAYKVVVEPQSLHGRQHREVCQRLQRRSACELVGATLHHRFPTGHTSNLFLSTTSVSRQVNLSKFAPVLRGATM